MNQKYIIIIFLLVLLLISIYLTYKKKETFQSIESVFYSGFTDENKGVCKTEDNLYPILQDSYLKSKLKNSKILSGYPKNVDKLHTYSNIHSGSGSVRIENIRNAKLDCLKRCRILPNYRGCEMITTEESDLDCYGHFGNNNDNKKLSSETQNMGNTFYLKWLWNSSLKFNDDLYELYENDIDNLDSGIRLPNLKDKINKDVIIFIAFTKSDEKNTLTPRNNELNKLLENHDKFIFSGKNKLMMPLDNGNFNEVNFVNQDDVKLYLGKITEFKHNEDLKSNDDGIKYQLQVTFIDDNGNEKVLNKIWPKVNPGPEYFNTKNPENINWFGVKILDKEKSKMILNNKENVCYVKDEPLPPSMNQIKLINEDPIYSVGDIVIVDGFKGVITTVHNNGEEYSIKIKSLKQRIRVPSNKVVHYQRHECYGMPDGHPCKNGSYCYNERKCQSLDKFKKVIIGAPHPSICSLGEVDDFWSSKYTGEIDNSNECNVSVFKPWLLRKNSDEFTKTEKEARNKLYDFTEYIESKPGGTSKCREGRKIMTKDECEEAANRTDGKKWGGVVNYKEKRPPGCYWLENGTYYFNEELDHLDWGENKKEYSNVGSVCKKQLCENEKFRNKCPATCYGCSKNKNYFHSYSKENL